MNTRTARHGRNQRLSMHIRIRNSLKSLALPVLIALLGMAVTAALTGCLSEKEEAPLREGGGSETTLSGRVVDAAGTPVIGAAIRIRPQGDLPPNLFSGQAGEAPFTPQAYSGPEGRYTVQGLASGSYFVECRIARGLAAMIPAELRLQDSVRLPDAVLHPTGVIIGRVNAPVASGEQPLVAAYVYLLGIWKRTVALDSTGLAFVLKDVPAGTYTLRAQASFPMDLSRWNVLERTDIVVPAGDTLDLDTLTLPVRAAVHDALYTRDSAAAAAFYLASLDSGEVPEPDWVERHFAVTGNRITMFYEFDGSFKRVSKDILALDALEYISLIGRPDSRLELPPGLSRLPNLKYLFLDHYDLSGLPAWTGTFPSLSHLSLTDLKAFPEWVYDIPTLYSLFVGDSLTTVPKGISKLKNLRLLGLTGNQISVFPAELLRMPSLEGVNLRYNHLCNTTAEEKAFLDKQDSLIFAAETDPLMATLPDTLKWQETQHCDP